MKLLILNGSTCSGKSTIIKNIMKQKKGIFYLSYDRLKWFFSDYKAEQYYRDIQKIILAIATSVFKIKYQVIKNFHKIRKICPREIPLRIVLDC